jgi:hypothetical protein
MSVWPDGGVGGVGGTTVAHGGSGGSPAGGSGGSGGSPVGGAGGSPVGGSSGGSLAVPGGTRDLATAQCTKTTGNTCPVPGDYIGCLQSKCGSTLTSCYYSDGVSTAAGGQCKDYANCMLACPCDSKRSACEDACRQNYAMANPSCSSCLVNLAICSSTNGCALPTTCSANTTGP